MRTSLAHLGLVSAVSLYRLLCVTFCWLLQPGMALAQQREPAVEVYGIVGTYFHGNQSIAMEWKPQFGAGILAPLGRNWGVLTDITTSGLEEYWNFDGLTATNSGSNYTRQRRIVLMPSLVRLWRRDRFSIYAGGGLGLEHERQRNRIRPIVGRDENLHPVVADSFQNTSVSRVTGTLAVRAGVVVSLTPKIVLRTGFSVMPRYIDARASRSLEFGVGYRF